MDLKINIQEELWEAIEKNYENESYSSAILDSIHLLTETIREKTGIEGDGSSLVGQAFGGDNPKIQLNKLQTDSDKNIQKGVQEILRGVYTAFRNPRSHDKYNDTKEDADAIIFFINYLLQLIDRSKINFEESTFLNRVFEEYYVRTREYSELLVNEIPKRQRTNIAIKVILQRKTGDISKLSYFMQALFDKLEENEISQVYKVISDELKYAKLEEEIRTILHIVPAKFWNKIEKVVKIRIENILFENVVSGKYDTNDNKCRFGALGTWIETEHLMNFENPNEWTYMVVNKLEKGDDEEIAYIEKYFWYKICKLNALKIDILLKIYIENGLKKKDEYIINKLKEIIIYEKGHPWWKVFEEELKNFPEIQYIEFPF